MKSKTKSAVSSFLWGLTFLLDFPSAALPFVSTNFINISAVAPRGVYCCTFGKFIEIFCVLEVSMAGAAEGSKGMAGVLVESDLKAAAAQVMVRWFYSVFF